MTQIESDLADRSPTHDHLLIDGVAVPCTSLGYQGHQARLATIDDLTIVCVTAGGIQVPAGLRWIEQPSDAASST